MTTNTHTINALIVDDERLARLELRQALSEFSDRVSVIGEARSKGEAVDFITSPPNGVRPEVIFLDINMPHGSGFDVLEEIDYEGSTPVQIVFVTAYDEYAVRAFAVNALDYLLKPIDPDRLERTIERLWKVLEKEGRTTYTSQEEPAHQGSSQAAPSLTVEDYIFVTLGKQRRFVPVPEIVCITANDNYSEIWLPDGKRAMMLRTMNEWEAMLPESDFLRIHRGTIINRSYLDASRPFEPTGGSAAFVYLRDIAEPFAISRRSFAKFKEQLAHYR
ncbi:MAG: LytR/AlgR family response regulator transcription factor [Candidatus Kapaibacteriota bacterium]